MAYILVHRRSSGSSYEFYVTNSNYPNHPWLTYLRKAAYQFATEQDALDFIEKNKLNEFHPLWEIEQYG